MSKKITAIFCRGYSRHQNKVLKVMKITIFLWFAAIMHVSAGTFAQKVSLNVKNAAMEQVLDLIGKQSGYNFLYNAKMLCDQ